MSRFLLLAVLSSLALFALAACGDGPDEDGDLASTPGATLAGEEPTPTAAPTRSSEQGPAAPTPAAIEGDGRLVFISDHTGNNEIWAIDPDGSDLQQLTDTPEQESSAYWSPDGTEIGFTRFSDEQELSFHVMAADGSNERASDERTLQGWVDRLSASRDGSVRISEGRVVDEAGEVILEPGFPPDAVGDVMVMSPDGTTITLGLAQDVFQGLPQDEVDRIIEEQDHLAMLELADNLYEVAVIEVATGETRNVTQSLGRDWLPVWGPDSQRIAYLGRLEAGDSAGIYVIDRDGENPGEIFPPPECDGCAGVSRVQWQR